MTTTIDYSSADVMENHRSYKGKEVAARHAREWASWNTVVSENKTPALGEVFEAAIWNGSENLPVWMAYDISATDEGWTITSYRWYSDPRETEDDEIGYVCDKCGETAVETEDGLWVHLADEDFTHLVRPVRPQPPFEVVAEVQYEDCKGYQGGCGSPSCLTCNPDDEKA